MGIPSSYFFINFITSFLQSEQLGTSDIDRHSMDDFINTCLITEDKWPFSLSLANLDRVSARAFSTWGICLTSTIRYCLANSLALWKYWSNWSSLIWKLPFICSMTNWEFVQQSTKGAPKSLAISRPTTRASYSACNQGLVFGLVIAYFKSKDQIFFYHQTIRPF